MTDKKSRRVVIINNINSDSIDQAIFILKSDPHIPQTTVNSSVAKEAQDIIDNYIRQVDRIKDGYSPHAIINPRKKRLTRFLLFAMGLLGAICVGLSLTLFGIVN